MKFDYEYVLNRCDQYWNRANEDRPLVYLFGPGNKRTIEKAAHHATIKDAWMDTEYQLKITREAIENTFYLGEAYPMMNPNLGPDFVGAVCGAELEFGNRTSWAEPCITDYEEFPPITFDKNNIWWKKIVEITEAALEDSKGDYIVGITDLHPGADGLVSLRGPQNFSELCKVVRACFPAGNCMEYPPLTYELLRERKEQIPFDERRVPGAFSHLDAPKIYMTLK